MAKLADRGQNAADKFRWKAFIRHNSYSCLALLTLILDATSNHSSQRHQSYLKPKRFLKLLDDGRTTGAIDSQDRLCCSILSSLCSFRPNKITNIHPVTFIRHKRSFASTANINLDINSMFSFFLSHINDNKYNEIVIPTCIWIEPFPHSDETKPIVHCSDCFLTDTLRWLLRKSKSIEWMNWIE